MKQKTIQRFGRLAAAAAFCLALGQAHAKAKPNVLFLFADDQCFETIGALDLTDIDTPNLDRLVNRGTQFTRAYNMGSWSGAVCVASRHMLITGRHIWRAQQASQVLRGKGKNLTPAQQATREAEYANLWPQVMGRAGYQTFFTGKWHIQAPADKAFQVARNIRGGMPNQTPQGYNRPLPDKPDPWSPYDVKFDGFWKGGKHWSEVVADDAVDYIGEATRDDPPDARFRIGFARAEQAAAEPGPLHFARGQFTLHRANDVAPLAERAQRSLQVLGELPTTAPEILGEPHAGELLQPTGTKRLLKVISIGGRHDAVSIHRSD